MERFIFTSLQHSVDILAGRRSSLGTLGGSSARPSFGGGMLPLMGESSPDLAMQGDLEEFGDLEFFSAETRRKIKASGSMLFA